MSKKIKVTGLELETKKGQKVELTLDEAKELHEQLDELFGKDVQYIPSQPLWFGPHYYRPYYTFTSTSPSTTTVSSSNTGMTVSYMDASTVPERQREHG